MEQIECASENRLSAYVRHELSDAEVARLEEHLVVCRACRLKILDRQADPVGNVGDLPLPERVREQLRMLPRRQAVSFRRSPRAPAFAIAALLLIVITAGGIWRFTHQTKSPSANNEVFRTDRKRPGSLKAISPAENAVVSGVRVEFKWTPEADALRYTVVILNESGDIMFQSETKATNFSVDPQVTQLQAGKKYYWHVRAKLNDGTDVETAPAAFSLTPN